MTKNNLNNNNNNNNKNDKIIKNAGEVYLIQTMPVEGGLLKGGYTYTMTAGELQDVLRKCQGIPQNQQLKLVGVGATESLGDEITYMGGKLFVISGEGGKITTEELTDKQLQNLKISFSQIALQSLDDEPKFEDYGTIKAVNSDKDAHEINHGGAFGALRDEVAKRFEDKFKVKDGKKLSAVVTIQADTKYIKSRAVCPKIKGTDKKIEPAADLSTMIKGGKVVHEGKEVEVTQQTVKEYNFKKATSIQMVGVITGDNMAENVVLKGLHVHCEYGHVLDLGDLENVKVSATPIAETFILLPKDKDGKHHWHTALKEEHMDSLKNFQKLAKAWFHRADNEVEFKSVKSEMEGKDVRSWGDHLVKNKDNITNKLPAEFAVDSVENVLKNESLTK